MGPSDHGCRRAYAGRELGRRGHDPASVVLSTGLRPYIEQAFTADHVAIDFAGFSGEALALAPLPGGRSTVTG
jgi:hypothetical protein